MRTRYKVRRKTLQTQATLHSKNFFTDTAMCQILTTSSSSSKCQGTLTCFVRLFLCLYHMALPAQHRWSYLCVVFLKFKLLVLKEVWGCPLWKTCYQHLMFKLLYQYKYSLCWHDEVWWRILEINCVENMLFASHLTEHFSFIEIIWKIVVRSFLGIDRLSSRAIAEMSRTDRRLVWLQKCHASNVIRSVWEHSRTDRRLVQKQSNAHLVSHTEIKLLENVKRWYINEIVK